MTVLCEYRLSMLLTWLPYASQLSLPLSCLQGLQHQSLALKSLYWHLLAKLDIAQQGHEVKQVSFSHFCLRFFSFFFLFFFANLWHVKNLLFETPPKRFRRFARNLAHSICVAVNNNFLQIWFQKGSHVYLHISTSEWQLNETLAPTSPWAPEGLCKILGDDHKVALFKLKYFISQYQLGRLTWNFIYYFQCPPEDSWWRG